MEKIEKKEIDGETWFKFNKKFDEERYKHFMLFQILGNSIMIIALIFLFLFIFPKLFENIEIIKENPLVYGARNIKPDNAEISCSCFFIGKDIKTKYYPISFNDKIIKVKNSEVNFTNLKDIIIQDGVMVNSSGS